MNHRELFVKTMLIVLALFGVACHAQSTSQPLLIPTETVAPIPLTETPTSTPTLEPTSTPTLTPTPMGGKNALLFYRVAWPQFGTAVRTIYFYNLVSQEIVPFSDEYAPLDVSPDGKKVLLGKDIWEPGDLFILDLSKPDNITLLQENIVDAKWLGNSDWIGFISVSEVNAKRQVFIVHPDGSDLTQVTNSSIGAVTLEPVFNDGVFWGEGTIASNGITKNIYEHKWTKLDGTETAYTNYYEVFPLPSGKFIMAKSQSASGPCWGCKIDLIDVATSFSKEATLLPPNNSVLDFVRPLSDDKWLVSRTTTSKTSQQFWMIYSSDGSILAEMPSAYHVVDLTGPPRPYDLLSPDGTWILVRKFEKTSDNQFQDTYHLFDTTTSEIQDLANMSFTNNGHAAASYFWIEIP